MGSSPTAPELATVPRERRLVARRRLRARGRRVFGRSALIGVGATALDVLALHVLIHSAGASPRVANVPALLLGTAAQYVGNKYFAFRDGSNDHLRQGSLFALVETGALALNAVGFDLLATYADVPYYAARPAVALAVYLLFSFPLWGRIFRG